MLADTLTLNLGGSGGTAFTVAKINQDVYSSEYRLTSPDGLKQYLLKIKHTTENPKNGQPMDRHYVSLKQVVFATSTVPQYEREFYAIYRVKPNDVAAADDIPLALCFWLTGTILGKLRGWES